MRDFLSVSVDLVSRVMTPLGRLEKFNLTILYVLLYFFEICSSKSFFLNFYSMTRLIWTPRWYGGTLSVVPSMPLLTWGVWLYPGRGYIPLYKSYRYVQPHWVGFLRRFGLKTGGFAHFSLESGRVFEGTTGMYGSMGSWWKYLSFQFQMSKKERQIIFACVLI